MTLDHDVAMLKRLPIFADFSSEQLRLIAFSAEPLNLPEGTVLFREGAAADGGYLVQSGSVRLYSDGEDEAVERGIAGPGSLIGEMAVLCPTTRPATGETLEQTQLLAISRRLLRRVFQEYPEMAQGLRQALSRRLTEMTGDLARSRGELLSGLNLEEERGAAD